MTSTNVANLDQMNKNLALGGGITGKKTRTNDDAASMFSAMMFQTTQNDLMAETDTAGMTQNTGGSAEAFDRFQYKENAVEEADVPAVTDRIDAAEEELSQFEEEIAATVSEELDVTEETVMAVLEEMGMTVFDLLDPQKLADVVMQISGITDSTELLLNADFQNLMTVIGQKGSELMKELDLNVDQLEELVAQMDVQETSVPVELPEMTEITEITEAVAVEATVQDEVPETKGTVAVEERVPVETKIHTSGVDEETETALPVTEVGDGTEEESTFAQTQEEPEQSFTDSRDTGRTVEEPVITHITQDVQAQNVEAQAAAPVEAESGSYLSVDTLDIIRQIAENVKVIMANDFSSMEMQLNPENLGRVYLNVSAKEGAVNAELAVQNEAVKEALEAQIATLRENLNQAGVKVDAVEVTVASHEFEKNLEQDARQEEEQARNQENGVQGRRNLRLDSLDELSGLMTEEETLAARIMRDNGNSVDLTA